MSNAKPPRKAPEQHPVASIPIELVEEIAYRWYISQLEPPLSLEQAARYEQRSPRTGHITNEASMRKAAQQFRSSCRGYLRVLYDMGMLKIAPDVGAAYRDDAMPERLCDHCGQPYRGPAVYCSLKCAIADA